MDKLRKIPEIEVVIKADKPTKELADFIAVIICALDTKTKNRKPVRSEGLANPGIDVQAEINNRIKVRRTRR